MTTELWILVAAAALQWALIMAAATPRIIKNGLPWALGNRDREAGVELPDWVHRLQRLSDNMQENLALFAILILVAHVSGSSNATSATGAFIFIGARIAHAGLYGVGIPYLRTLLWSVSVVGMFVVASTLL